MLDKIGIAKRIAQEVQDGFYVNLGINSFKVALISTSGLLYQLSWFIHYLSIINH